MNLNLISIVKFFCSTDNPKLLQVLISISCFNVNLCLVDLITWRGGHAFTTAFRNVIKSRRLDIVPRVYFTGEQDVNEFVLHLDNYISYNNIPEKNKYLLVKCPLKEDSLFSLENTGTFLVRDEVQWYEQTITELKKTFPAIIDKSVLCREFCCNKQSTF